MIKKAIEKELNPNPNPAKPHIVYNIDGPPQIRSAWDEFKRLVAIVLIGTPLTILILWATGII